MKFNLRQELRDLGFDGKIVSIDKLGGMTNFNFKIKIEGDSQLDDGFYVLRLPGEGMDEVLINRPNEVKILEMIHNTDLKDLAVDAIAWNDKGVKLTKFFQAKNLDANSRDAIVRGLKHVMELHDRGYDFGVRMDPFDILNDSLQQMVNCGLHEDLASIFEYIRPEQLLKLQEFYRHEYTEDERRGTACHCDALPDNFMFFENGDIKLLDFEFARMTDKCWEYVAILKECGMMGVDEQIELLAEVMEITPRLRQQLLIVSAVNSAWLSAWGYLAFYERGHMEALEYGEFHKKFVPQILEQLQDIL